MQKRDLNSKTYDYRFLLFVTKNDSLCPKFTKRFHFSVFVVTNVRIGSVLSLQILLLVLLLRWVDLRFFY